MARTRIVAAEFLVQVFVAVDDAIAALDVGLGREAAATFAGGFKSAPGIPSIRSRLWDTSFVGR
jgi:hypothetical protein